MLGRKKKSNHMTNTVIGEGVTLEAAKLTGEGSARIDGKFVGDVELDGDLILGESGIVEGNVQVRSAMLAGKVEGNILCQTRLHIAGTALISGMVESQSLVVDEGAAFNGSCHMGAPDTAFSKNSELHRFESAGPEIEASI